MKITSLCKSYGGRAVLSDLSVTFEDGKITALRAPSGWGKTTLFRLIAGLEAPDSGTVEAGSGKIAYLFQEPRLFPSVSALENVSCVSRLPKSEASALLEKLGIPAEEQKKRPAALSGGMNQRIAIARLLHFCRSEDVHLVLLDEPFKGLDPGRKEQVENVVFAALKGKTVLLITHDPDEEKRADAVIDLTAL